MVSKSEVADVLERAADLYESEEIDWCLRAWGRETGLTVNHDGVIKGQFHCAEGAILRAAGFTMRQIIESQGSSAGNPVSVVDLLETPVVLGALSAVKEHLGDMAPGQRLWQYNDGLLLSDGKQTLIQVFKETAKELRNAS